MDPIPLRAHRVQGALKPYQGIRNVLAVASGKGGVGKSTTAYSLARSWQKQGYRVGFLDADIHGPSLPTLSDTKAARIQATKHPVTGKLSVQPLSLDGMLAVSFAFLLGEADQPVIWRGPMVGSALTQLFGDTQWGELDLLVVDLPPGTGDILLTLCQKIPVTAAILVTTPSDLALADVIRAHRMFEKMGVHVAGWVENMAEHRCSACGHADPLWGDNRVAVTADACGVPVLGKLPLWSDKTDDLEKDRLYSALGDSILGCVRALPVAYAHRFPEVVCETPPNSQVQ